MIVRLFSKHVAFVQIQFLVRLALLDLQISANFVKIQLIEITVRLTLLELKSQIFVKIQLFAYTVLLDLRISVYSALMEMVVLLKIELFIY